MFFDRMNSEKIAWRAPECKFGEVNDNEMISEDARSRLKRSIVTYYNGEFDPGSGRTLAAGLTHASRRGFRDFGP